MRRIVNVEAITIYKKTLTALTLILIIYLFYLIVTNINFPKDLIDLHKEGAIQNDRTEFFEKLSDTNWETYSRTRPTETFEVLESIYTMSEYSDSEIKRILTAYKGLDGSYAEMYSSIVAKLMVRDARKTVKILSLLTEENIDIVTNCIIYGLETEPNRDIVTDLQQMLKANKMSPLEIKIVEKIINHLSDDSTYESKGSKEGDDKTLSKKMIKFEKLIFEKNLNVELIDYAFVRGNIYYSLNVYLPQTNTCKYSVIVKYCADKKESHVVYRIDYTGESNGITTMVASNDNIYWLEESLTSQIMALDLDNEASKLVKKLNRYTTVNYIANYYDGIYWVESENSKLRDIFNFSSDSMKNVQVDNEMINTNSKVYFDGYDLYYQNNSDPKNTIRKVSALKNSESKIRLSSDIDSMFVNRNFIVWTDTSIPSNLMSYNLKSNKVKALISSMNLKKISILGLSQSNDKVVVELESQGVSTKSIMQIDLMSGKYGVLCNSAKGKGQIWDFKNQSGFIFLNENKNNFELEVYEIN